MSKPTPKPWVKTSDEFGSPIIKAGNCRIEFNTDGAHDFKLCKTTAAHIVKCVNMHDELLAALDLAERALENVTNEQFKAQSLTYIKKVQAKAEGRGE